MCWFSISQVFSHKFVTPTCYHLGESLHVDTAFGKTCHVDFFQNNLFQDALSWYIMSNPLYNISHSVQVWCDKAILVQFHLSERIWLNRDGFFTIPFKYFPSTFLQPVNSGKNSILNWVMKLNLFMCFFLFLKNLFLSYLPILLTLWFRYLRKRVKETCMYV